MKQAIDGAGASNLTNSHALGRGTLTQRAQPRITVLFRYDDCNSESSTGVEHSIIDAFSEFEMPLTFGVTPLITSGEVDSPEPCSGIPLDRPKIQMLKRAASVVHAEIALHGLSHQTIRPASHGGCSEFAGLSLCSQFERIANGKRLLETLVAGPVTTLIPPWNSYDENTIRASLMSGLRSLSADVEGHTSENLSICYVPATCTLECVKSAICWSRFTRDPSPLIVGLFHPYDFSKTARPKPMTTDKLRHLLQWIKRQKDVAVLTIAGLNARGDDLSGQRLHRYRASRRRLINRMIPGYQLRGKILGDSK